MALRNWFGRLIVVVVCIAVSSIGLSGEADAGTVDVTVLHHNVCGWNSDCGPSGHSTRVDDLRLYVQLASPKPWVVTLNETCLSQMMALGTTMGPLGYSGQFQPTKLNGCDPGHHYGNAIFMLGGSMSVYQTFYPVAHQKPGTTEIRAGMCGRSTSFLGWYFGCTTHLVNEEGFKQSQSNDFQQWLRTLSPSDPMLIAGDFNLESLGFWWPFFFNHIDHGVPTYNRQVVPSQEIDHILRRNGSFPGLVLNGTVCAPWTDLNSIHDHCVLGGGSRVTV